MRLLHLIEPFTSLGNLRLVLGNLSDDSILGSEWSDDSSYSILFILLITSNEISGTKQGVLIGYPLNLGRFEVCLYQLIVIFDNLLSLQDGKFGEGCVVLTHLGVLSCEG